MWPLRCHAPSELQKSSAIAMSFTLRSRCRGARPILGNRTLREQESLLKMTNFGGEMRSVRIVRDHHYRLAVLLVEAGEQRQNVLRRCRIEITRRFVGEDQIR